MKLDASVLKIPGFRRLWASQVASLAATNILTFAFVLAVYAHSKSNAAVAVLVGMQSIPPILFSSLAGVLADSYDRRRVLIFVHLTRAASVVLAIIFAKWTLGVLLAAFIMHTLSQLFTPATSAAIPQVVPKEKLFAANSFFTLTTYALFLIGYGAAAPLIDLFGDRLTYAIGLMFYLLAVLVAYRLPELADHLAKLKEPRLALAKHLRLVWVRFVEGVKYVRKDAIIGVLLLQVSILIAVEKSFASLMPSFALDFLGFRVRDITLVFIIPTAVGTLLGVFLANKLKHRIPLHRLVTFGITLDALALLLAIAIVPLAHWLPDLIPAFSPNGVRLALVILLAGASGFADPFILVSAQTVLQDRTPNHEQGRVFGLQNTVQNLFAFVPVIGIGALSGIIAVPAVITSLGAIVGITAIAGAVFFHKHQLTTGQMERHKLPE
ncbi:MAG: MFS transporter [Patescibacteria group bacterium]|jgi:MFS family permease